MDLLLNKFMKNTFLATAAGVVLGTILSQVVKAATKDPNIKKAVSDASTNLFDKVKASINNMIGMEENMTSKDVMES
jgi:hypothetical protein